MEQHGPRPGKGAFVISIDAELAWGWVFSGLEPSRYPHWDAYGRVRGAIDRLLLLMDRYEIRATWAVVGHLFLDGCGPADGRVHPEVLRPRYGWFGRDDWFYADPASSVEEAPEWYGPDIIRRIQAACVRHEIGSHSFSHMEMDGAAVTREVFASDIEACMREAAGRGVVLRSFVYPKNRVAHTDVLAEKGFETYRSPGREWFDGLPRPLWRVAHKLDAFLPVPPRAVRPESVDGMAALPASYYYRHRGGWARRQPMWLRALKMRMGLRRAAAQRSVFHLWFHPYDIATGTEAMLRPLESAFREAARLRDAGRLESLTMSELAGEWSGALAQGPRGAGAVQAAPGAVRSR
ncbi:MAG: polysaccharide deacetylase family protein [Dehalococcoidia bacterium]